MNKLVSMLAVLASTAAIGADTETAAAPAAAASTIDATIEPESADEKNAKSRCGSDPMIYLQQHMYTQKGIDVFTMKNFKGNVIGCAMHVTFEIREWDGHQYVYTGTGRICLKDGVTKNAFAAPTTRLARLEDVTARFNGCTRN